MVNVGTDVQNEVFSWDDVQGTYGGADYSTENYNRLEGGIETVQAFIDWVDDNVNPATGQMLETIPVLRQDRGLSAATEFFSRPYTFR